MRIEPTSRILTATVIALSVFAIGCALLSRLSRSQQERAGQMLADASRFGVQLTLGTDRLTEAVRGFTATGERRYYNDFVRELTVDRTLDRAVVMLQRLGLTPDESALLQRAKQNSDRLVLVQNRAFEAAGRGNLRAASVLVYGDEHQQARAAVTQTIADCRQAVEGRLLRRAAELTQRARRQADWAMAALVVDIAVVLASLVLFYRRRVVRPLVALSRGASDSPAQTNGGQVASQFDTSEIGEIARTLESSRRGVADMEVHRWIKAHVAEVAAALGECETLKEFAQRLLLKLVLALKAEYGACYIGDDAAGGFQLTALHGLGQGQTVPSLYTPGEGMVGRCAVEKKVLCVGDLPEVHRRLIKTGEDVSGRRLLVVPVLRLGRVLAVVEIVLSVPPTPTALALCEEVGPLAALHLELLRLSLRANRPADEPEPRAEEMQVAQEAVRSAEARARLLLAATAEGIYGIDGAGQVVFVNPAGCRLLGYRAEDLYGRSAHQVLHLSSGDGRSVSPDQCPLCAAARRSEASRIEDCLLQRGDGGIQPVECMVTPTLADGTVAGAIVSFADSTERLRLQTQLAERVAFQRALVDAVPYPMFVKDAEARFVGCNRAYAEAFGFGSEALKGRTVLDFDHIPIDERQRLYKEDRAVIREGGRRSYEMAINFIDGRTHATLYSVEGFRREDGSAGGVVGVFVDLTDRKRIEADLATARETAEAAVRAKSEWLATMSPEPRSVAAEVLPLAVENPEPCVERLAQGQGAVSGESEVELADRESPPTESGGATEEDVPTAAAKEVGDSQLASEDGGTAASSESGAAPTEVGESVGGDLPKASEPKRRRERRAGVRGKKTENSEMLAGATEPPSTAAAEPAPSDQVEMAPAASQTVETELESTPVAAAQYSVAEPGPALVLPPVDPGIIPSTEPAPAPASLAAPAAEAITTPKSIRIPKPAKPAKRKKESADHQLNLFPLEIEASQETPVAVSMPTRVEVAEAETTQPAPEAPAGREIKLAAEEKPQQAVQADSEVPLEAALAVESTPTAAVDLSGLPEVGGLDTADGLMRTAGNRRLYLKLLRQFVAEQAGAVEQIRDLLVQGQAEEAARSARALKDAARNIGAANVRAAADELERAITASAEPADIESLWGRLQNALSDLLPDLKLAVQGPEKKPAPVRPPDPARLKKAVDQVLTLLAESDPGAADCLKDNRAVFQWLFAPDIFADFEKHVKSQAFEQALEPLRKAAKKHGVIR